MLVFRGPGPGSNRKEKKTDESKRTAVTQCLGLTLGVFVAGLVSGAVTGFTNPWVTQLVDKIGAAIHHLNEERVVATVPKPVNADFSSEFILGHCRMIFA